MPCLGEVDVIVSMFSTVCSEIFSENDFSVMAARGCIGSLHMPLHVRNTSHYFTFFYFLFCYSVFCFSPFIYLSHFNYNLVT